MPIIHKLRYIDTRADGSQRSQRQAFSYCRQDKPFGAWLDPGHMSATTWSAVTCQACHAMAPDHSNYNKSNERYKQRLRESRRMALIATEKVDV